VKGQRLDGCREGKWGKNLGVYLSQKNDYYKNVGVWQKEQT